MRRRFTQVDVFTAEPYRGNPLAVVVDGEGLDDDTMHRFANWTNLSETTFLLPPTDPAADYRVRIFTPTIELPFAGHPTLGSCATWLAAGGRPNVDHEIVQECGVGLVRIRRTGDGLAFSAPPLVRSGPVDDERRDRIEQVLGRPVVDAAWAANGPNWVAAELPDAETVLAVRPDFSGGPVFGLGIVGRAAGDADHDVEVRAFFEGPNGPMEDPVTGSLNASLAQWLMGRDPSLTSYVARQGTALGRDGRVRIERDASGTIWVGGDVTTCIEGQVEL
jgi:PhzF family phenazine biosynthesis protein